MKPTSKSEENKIDLATVNKSKKQLKLPEIKNPLTKQKGPKRDDEGKFTAGSGGLRRLNSFNLKRALPLFVIISLVGGSMVYQSFAAACSITADKTSLYEGESTTIRWKSPSVPVVIDGGNMGSVKDGQWGSGALYATKTFKLVGGWDSSCTDSVTVTVSKKPATNPANPTTPAPTNPVTTPSPTTPAPGGGSALTDADAKFKWTDAQVKIARQNRDKAKSIAGQGSVSKAQLDSIALLEKWVRDAVAQSTPYIGDVQTSYNQAKTAKKSQDEQNKLLYYSGAINNNVQEMSRIITEIANSYTTARQKYESAQKPTSNPNPITANPGTGGKGGIGTTPVTGLPTGVSQAQRVEYARAYCNRQPDYTETRAITGGSRGEIRDVYHNAGNTYCNNRLIRVTWINCNTSSGYEPSENADGTIKICVKKSADVYASYYSLPKLPYIECADMNITFEYKRCVRNLTLKNKQFSGGTLPYIVTINHCQRAVIFGAKNDRNCKTENGQWRYR